MHARLFIVLAAVALAVSPLTAQWKRPFATGAPRTVVDPEAPAPRTADGHTDLSGLWRPSGIDRSDLAFGSVPMTDEGEALKAARQARFERDFPKSHCLPMGIVNLHAAAGPVKFIQVPGELVMLMEQNSERREIFTDGRALPGSDARRLWNGYSVGVWDGDTLVVTTAGLRDGQWLDPAGTPQTDAAIITERFRRLSLERMEVVIRVDDRRTFLRPATIRAQYRLAPDDELIESICLENNKWRREAATP